MTSRFPQSSPWKSHKCWRFRKATRITTTLMSEIERTAPSRHLRQLVSDPEDHTKSTIKERAVKASHTMERHEDDELDVKSVRRVSAPTVANAHSAWTWWSLVDQVSLVNSKHSIVYLHKFVCLRTSKTDLSDAPMSTADAASHSAVLALQPRWMASTARPSPPS